MTRATPGLCFTLSLFFATSAIAAEPDKGPDYARSGLYLGVAGTYALEEFDDVGGTHFDDSLGMNARVGYRLHPNFSAELAFEWLEGIDVEASGGTEIETWSVIAKGKGHLLTGPMQPFLSAGVGVMEIEIDVPGTGSHEDDGFVARFGGGLDVYATENCVVSMGADYVFPTGEIDGADYIAVQWGFQYRF